ncbi:hypothetical protein TIFTF001_022272 [Ficus carica]|uniref:beta-galactosidase n=1 Tax=Ficus carica TaxID=3494 RepID=A0AA88AIC2_FICCA|nr:hypothetical protein TIFTF001_022272 [Ficus carica]
MGLRVETWDMLRGKNKNMNMLFMFILLVLFSWLCSSATASVTYDHRAIIINGKRRILISGSIHYPRSTPEMWPDLIQKAKDGGLDVIQTYVFWNGHEPTRGQYYFEDRYDLVKFIKLVRQAGLYVHLRIGPYICGEWNFGGFPVWLKYVPGIAFRTDNGPFKNEMQKFTTKIVNMMKAERLFETQGGPIILSQIDTCNGFYCENYKPNQVYKPKMWTEVWTGWYTEFGGPVPTRPAEDLAFAVARFIQNGGAFFNYYMYHGGTNFGHTSGGPFIATSYDYDAPLDEYGLPREPKWGHLRDLHRAIKLAESALVSSDPTVTKLGNNQEAHVFRSNTGACAAFLSNLDTNNAARVSFGNKQYDLPPCGGTFASDGLTEQLSVTWDKTDYLWYLTDITIGSDEGFLKTGNYPLLTVYSAGHALLVFVNGQLTGKAYGSLDSPKLTFTQNIKLRVGVNKLALLSVAVGLPNVGLHFETWNAGVLGPVTLKGLNSGTWDMSKWKWSYKTGLEGEDLSLQSGSSSVQWAQGSFFTKQQPLTWYTTTFNAPGGNGPLALDMNSMGKGEVWINGRSIGRYWPAYKARGGCGPCNYAGFFTDKKCQTGCGQPSQRWYHVPRSWLKPAGNVMVVFEEWGGDPDWISLVQRTARTVCADIHEGQPAMDNWAGINSGRASSAKAHLWCAPGHKISQIKFASYGVPQGTCGNYQEGSCHAHKSYDVPQQILLRNLKVNLPLQNCIGQQSCSVIVAPQFFGGDPCPGVAKKLSLEAVCS